MDVPLLAREDQIRLTLPVHRTFCNRARRMFMARTVQALGESGQRLAERKLGWNRGTIRKGMLFSDVSWCLSTIPVYSAIMRIGTSYPSPNRTASIRQGMSALPEQ